MPEQRAADIILAVEDEELRRLATNVVQLEPGLWVSETTALPLSFPDHGHEEIYQVEDQSFWFSHRNRCITEVLSRYPPSGPLFDVGGGNGYVSMAVKSSGFDAVLVEPAIDGARFGISRGLRPVVCSTLAAAGFEAGSLPAVGIFDVLEHVEDDRAFLEDVRRLLSSDGRLYLTVPAYGWLWSSEDVFAGHFRRYTLRAVRRLLSKVGFRVEYQTYFFSLLPLPIFLFRSVPGYFGSKPSVKGHQRDHDPSGSSLIGWLLDRELALIRRGLRIPFGSSCLVVATPVLPP